MKKRDFQLFSNTELPFFYMSSDKKRAFQLFPNTEYTDILHDTR